MVLIRRLIQEIFIFQATVLKFDDLLGKWLQQLQDLSTRSPKLLLLGQKNTGTWGVNTTLTYNIHLSNKHVAPVCIFTINISLF